MNLGMMESYGLIAIGYIAKQAEGSWVSAEEISKEFDIPNAVMVKVMQQYVRAGVLQSKRGPLGGFSLAKPAKEISLLEIIEAVDGPVKNSTEIAEMAKKQRFAVKMEATCNKAADQAMAILEKAKLSDLVK